MRRRVLVTTAAGLVLFGLMYLGGRYYGFIWPTHGPLGDASGNSASGRTPAGGIAVLMYQLPDSRLDAPVELQSAELVGKDPALQPVGMRVVPCPSPVTDDCVFGIVEEGWPLTVQNHPVAGYRLDAGGNPNIAVALRVPKREATYRVRGLLLHYSQGWRRFQTEIGPNARIEAR